MQKLSSTDQRGIAHLALIIVLIVVVGGVGFAAMRVMHKDKAVTDKAAAKVASIIASKECKNNYNDEDLCKFLSSWNGNKKFQFEATTTTDDETSKTAMTVDGDNSYVKMDGGLTMEMISIGGTTYTKAGETWWKESAKSATTESPTNSLDLKFKDPATTNDQKDLNQYIKVGKEACGKLSCFKYKVVDPKNTETTEYIWFDDDAYLIRKTLSESNDGSSKAEATFSYNNVSVTVPSPVKQLDSNQYIVPGQTEPQTIPS